MTKVSKDLTDEEYFEAEHTIEVSLNRMLVVDLPDFALLSKQ